MYAWEIVLISLLFVIIECAIMELQSTPVRLKVNRAIATFMFLLAGGCEENHDVNFLVKMETIITVIYIAAMFSHLNEIVVS